MPFSYCLTSTDTEAAATWRLYSILAGTRATNGKPWELQPVHTVEEWMPSVDAIMLSSLRCSVFPLLRSYLKSEVVSSSKFEGEIWTCT